MITPQLVIWESQRPSRKLEAGFTGPDSEEMLKTGAEPVMVVHQGNGCRNLTVHHCSLIMLEYPFSM